MLFFYIYFGVFLLPVTKLTCFPGALFHNAKYFLAQYCQEKKKRHLARPQGNCFAEVFPSFISIELGWSFFVSNMVSMFVSHSWKLRQEVQHDGALQRKFGQ